MIDHYYAVIMAGGGGTRLWPYSRQARPKQLLDITGNGRTLFQMAVDRLQGVLAPEKIFIVTTASLAKMLQEQVPEIPTANYLLEPMPRGTASVVGFAAAVLQKLDPHPQTCMAVLTADHFIQNIPDFRDLLKSAYLTAQENYLVTLGIRPTFPSTGYGYIEKGNKVGCFGERDAYQVIRFTEKPDEERAKKMIQQGNYDWNSGMFIWRVAVILEKMASLMPELYEGLKSIQKSWNTENQKETVESIWNQLKPETIDYGIMEKVADAVVIPAEALGWNDVGSWESLFDVLPADENGNIIIGTQHTGLNTSRTLVFSEDPGRLITTIGLNNMIIVDSGDALLVCSRDDSQNVRKLIELIKQKERGEYL